MEQSKSASTIMSAELSKRGLVSLWESGGGCCNTGEATIIAKPDGGKPTAIYFRRSGHLSNGNHALIPVHPGYFVVVSYHHHRDFVHTVYKVLRTSIEGEEATVELTKVNAFDRGEWDTEVAEALRAAIEAAEAKATDYHCRQVYYACEKEKKQD